MRRISFLLVATIAAFTAVYLDSPAQGNSSSSSPNFAALEAKIAASRNSDPAWVRYHCDNYFRAAYKRGKYISIDESNRSLCYRHLSMWFSFYRAHEHYQDYETLRNQGEKHSTQTFYLEKAVYDIGEARELGHPDAGPLLSKWRATAIRLGSTAGHLRNNFAANSRRPETYISNGRIVRRAKAQQPARSKSSSRSASSSRSTRPAPAPSCKARMSSVQFCHKRYEDRTTTCDYPCGDMPYLQGSWCDLKTGYWYHSRSDAQKSICGGSKGPTREECVAIRDNLQRLRRIGGVAVLAIPQIIRDHVNPCKKVGVRIQ